MSELDRLNQLASMSRVDDSAPEVPRGPMSGIPEGIGSVPTGPGIIGSGSDWMHHISQAHNTPMMSQTPGVETVAAAPPASSGLPTVVPPAHTSTELVTNAPSQIAGGGDIKTKTKKRRMLLIVALLVFVVVMVRLSSKLTNAARAKTASAKSTKGETNSSTTSETSSSTNEPTASTNASQPDAPRTTTRAAAAQPPPVAAPARNTENTTKNEELSATNRVRQQAEERANSVSMNDPLVKKKDAETVSADEYFMPI